MENLEKLLTETEAAELLGLSPGSLKQDRHRRVIGLPYLKVGRLVRYSPADLRAWLAARRRVPVGGQEVKSRGGRPTRAEQIEAASLGITVPELRVRRGGGGV